MSKFDKAAEAGKGILSLIGKGARKGSEMAIDAYKAPLTQDMIQRGKQGMQGLGDEINALRARAAQPQPTIQELQEELHHIIKRHGQVKVADGLPDGARQQLLDAFNEQANDVIGKMRKIDPAYPISRSRPTSENELRQRMDRVRDRGSDGVDWNVEDAMDKSIRDRGSDGGDLQRAESYGLQGSKPQPALSPAERLRQIDERIAQQENVLNQYMDRGAPGDETLRAELDALYAEKRRIHNEERIPPNEFELNQRVERGRANSDFTRMMKDKPPEAPHTVDMDRMQAEELDRLMMGGADNRPSLTPQQSARGITVTEPPQPKTKFEKLNQDADEIQKMLDSGVYDDDPALYSQWNSELWNIKDDLWRNYNVK